MLTFMIEPPELPETGIAAAGCCVKRASETTR
jgi:hypothetical protein